MIPEQTTDQIRAEATALRVAEILRLPLKKRGGRWWASCPLHADETPSLSIGPRPEVWYCHSCAAGGDGIHLYRAVEGVGFIVALRQLAGELGITITDCPRPAVDPWEGSPSRADWDRAFAALRRRIDDQRRICWELGRGYARYAYRHGLSLADRRRIVDGFLCIPAIIADVCRVEFEEGFSDEWEYLHSLPRCQLRAPGKSRELTTEEKRP